MAAQVWQKHRHVRRLVELHAEVQEPRAIRAVAVEQYDGGRAFRAAHEPAARARPVAVRPSLFGRLQTAVAQLHELFGRDEVRASGRVRRAVDEPDGQAYEGERQHKDDREQRDEKLAPGSASRRHRTCIVKAKGKRQK